MSPIAAIVPVLNEQRLLRSALSALQTMHEFEEIIIVDGESSDGSSRIASRFSETAMMSSSLKRTQVRAIQSPPSRGLQMNAGAAIASSPILLFLHVDTQLPREAVGLIRDAIHCGFHWGRFDVQLDDSRIVLRIIARAMNIRSALTGIATGDQAIFVSRRVFNEVGGFSDVPLMEDIILSKRLKRLGRPAIIHNPVLISARRWQSRGVLRTVGEMWMLRLMFWFGVAPSRLSKWYYTSKA
ncbi:MAG: TIGR04283 family arsenosugar biosynthesis glycosyltransferase [Gammaproteobacteria bacterium]|nr:TIGR04283 family arsenosugar biosynthesis glycosyltransferase [Gammaproteobacteria bacterium]